VAAVYVASPLGFSEPGRHDPAGPARREALVRMSRTIGERNRTLLAGAAAVPAVPDGPDVDSGTAAEVGWAAAHRIPVSGGGATSASPTTRRRR
jgi:nucleoside 2-deoxyribosyltransferase